jgi:hypothetical protein
MIMAFWNSSSSYFSTYCGDRSLLTVSFTSFSVSLTSLRAETLRKRDFLGNFFAGSPIPNENFLSASSVAITFFEDGTARLWD